MSFTDLRDKNQAEPSSTTANELLARIEDWAAAGDYEAITDCLPKMVTPEQFYLATLALGFAYTKREKYAEAEACLRQATERGRDDSIWQYRLAETLLFQDNTENALKHALLAREKDPQYPLNYLLLGKLFYFNGNKIAAKEYIQTGMALAREAGCNDSDFARLLREIENGNDPKTLLKA